MYYNHKPSSHGGYCDTSESVLWAFGHGKSYTSFNYSKLVCPSSPVPADGLARVSFTLSNLGNRDGVEVAQLYLRVGF